MWVVVATAGAAVVGGVASNIAANKSANAAKDASKTQAESADRALEFEQEQFEYQKRLNEPFYNMGLPAAYQYASAITGQPQTYADPRYQQLTEDEVADLNSTAVSAPVGQGTLSRMMSRSQPAAPKYDTAKKWYRGPDGQIVESTPTVTTGPWTPQETEAYKWQQQQMEKNTSRSLRAMGRYNSTYGMDAITKGNSNLAASEYDKQLGRLADLTNVARGGASSLSSMAGQFANSASNNIINSGNNQANATLAGGMMQANAINNGVSGLYSLANMGLQAYGK